jgi:restriction system protein
VAVPDYQSFMLPLLKLASDGREHSLREAIELVAQQFNLTEEDKKELLPSGRQYKLNNRVSWARTYLTKAGLLEKSGRGKFRITGRGIDVLRQNPAEITSKFLEQFEEFRQFKRTIPSAKHHDKKPESLEPPSTPEEILEEAYQALRRSLAQELLERVKGCSPNFFERLVVDLLLSMGYGGSRQDAGQAVGQSGDEGIDGIIKEDKLGLDVVYIQAKRWKDVVGPAIVRDFIGALEGKKATKGVLITTSRFSEEAIEAARQAHTKKIVLIDGERLSELMIDHNIGVTEAASYVVKKIDLDYFEED